MTYLPMYYFAYFQNVPAEHSYFLIDLQRLFITLILCDLHIIFLHCVDWLLFMIFIDVLQFKVCFSKIFMLFYFVVRLRKSVPTQSSYMKLHVFF